MQFVHVGHKIVKYAQKHIVEENDEVYGDVGTMLTDYFGLLDVPQSEDELCLVFDAFSRE